jgi:flagella basal body P-ring formation protein FlgA
VTRFELWEAGELVGNWQAVLQAKVWRPVPVAQSLLVRGQLLRDADITLERRDVLLLRDTCLEFPISDPDLEVAERIQAGMPVSNREVRERPLVQRGHLVEAVYQDGALSSARKVEILEDGARGQVIRVRNPKTRRELLGKVQNEQTVLISL